MVELEGRDELEGRNEVGEAGRRGSGEVAVASSNAARSSALPAGAPWDKAPEQWTLADVFRILQNSPWSPSKFSLESNYTQRTTNSQSGVVDDSPVNGRNTAVVPGVTLTRGHPLPAVTVLWWSSKTIRLAEAKRVEARAGAKGAFAKNNDATITEIAPADMIFFTQWTIRLMGPFSFT